MSDIEAIRLRAAALVRQGWCQGSFAVDASGTPEEWDSPGAVGWCAEGALRRAAGEAGNQFGDAIALADTAAHVVGYCVLGVPDLMEWNDNPNRTSEQVALALEGRRVA